MRDAFHMGGVSIKAGSRAQVNLPLPHQSSYTPMTMPVQVIHGKRDGPTLFVSAAIHGDEINGVEIIRELLTSLLERGVTIRRRLGGGMRQSGVLAAACLFALDHHLPFLSEDHAKARTIAEVLADHGALTVVRPETNIVMMDLRERLARPASEMVAAAGVRLSVYGERRLRAVTHLGVSHEDVRHAAEIISRVLA